MAHISPIPMQLSVHVLLNLVSRLSPKDYENCTAERVIGSQEIIMNSRAGLLQGIM